MNATIRDVAEAAGVSISSVHIALSGKKGVSESTRALIKEVAERLGYQPNENAASLKRKRQKILIVLPGCREITVFSIRPCGRESMTMYQHILQMLNSLKFHIIHTDTMK